MAKKDRDETVARLTAEGLPLHVIQETIRRAKALDRYAVDQLNRPVSNAETARACLHERKLTELLKKYRCTPSFNHDPRGGSVKVKVPSGKGNDFGGDGLVVVAY